MAWPEDDERHREVLAALRAWARKIDSTPYPPGLDIDALMARHYASLDGELEPPPVMGMVVTATAETTVLTVGGEIDLSGSRRLRQQLTEEVGLAPRLLLLDLTGTAHCSARGLAVLLEATADAREAGVPFAIVGCAPVVRRAVDALGLETALPIHATIGEAIEWLELLERLKTSR
ncbi:STAS domain-containing protein [Amycolatopsis sp. OK19-0408]|uniref:STAS domain-containing protein n=1 Tax=Amycolatopsis iheyensis TaxID=2945988 RepID=A0A9X2N781_9PSEU|nr:STAS domain-containing protein [Amycolatopsis iheyensis]MCR6483601.1 STAS domain-containing protein [Amycolatopsis iheyensis]